MSIDLTGINNYNEYYSNHYFASVFEENTEETLTEWRNRARDSVDFRTPWALLRDAGRQYYIAHDKFLRSRSDRQLLPLIRSMADYYLDALGYPAAGPKTVIIPDNHSVPVYLEIKKSGGAPLLWVLLAHAGEDDALMQGFAFGITGAAEDSESEVYKTAGKNEDLATRILYAADEPPRWLIFIGLNQIALIDRNKWNEKRYLQFELEEIFSRREETTLQAMAVLLHKESLCPDDNNPLLDKLDENSHRHSSGVSQDLKYALRESIELLGNEVLYSHTHQTGGDSAAEQPDAGKLSMECLRYMYRMLFMLFIESRPELGYAPMKAQAYVQGYSLESLRDIADSVREDTDEVGNGYFLHETITKLFDLIYNGYPENEEAYKELTGKESLHDIFLIDPLKAHIFDPEYTPLIASARLRNRVMLRIINLMSITRSTGRRNDRRGRISYSMLGINQMGAVYEALLSYRGFIAEDTLFEVKRERDEFNELDVGYFVPESELHNYTEEERVRYPDGKLRKYEKGTFIYRLAGREREKSASYYTPEVLTKCLVKYALKELLENKTADEILQLTVCEPAMGSAAFLNEAVNQLAEAYLERKQKELNDVISYENRQQELQRVKMYIADRNVYGIDLNPIAVELAEVSLWLNTIYKGSFVPWFGTQLINGNSLIGARKQCYRIEQLQAGRAPDVWYENAPERVMPGSSRMTKKQIYHFLTGDPGMCDYTDAVIKSLAPDEIKEMKTWNRGFTRAHSDDEIQTLLRLSATVDELWKKQADLRRDIGKKTADSLSVYGYSDDTTPSHTTIREKDILYKRLYKSEEMNNAGPYARLKFAMDYWCALWFWPIDKADLLPSRSEFLFDMSLILEGTVDAVKVTDTKNTDNLNQLSFFPTEMQQMSFDISSRYDDIGLVDIPALCERNPRLRTAKEIADQNHFLHWELEFADLFDERGGFDLIIGNPPWVKITWNEQSVLADKNPLFAVKNYTATQTVSIRTAELLKIKTRALYYSEYAEMSGIQNFTNATQNYSLLKKQQTNLYKCFLPQAWDFGTKRGVAAFIHPDSIFDDPDGAALREVLYPKLRKHFQFMNMLKLFHDVHSNVVFGANIYCNQPSESFEMIANLYTVSAVDDCYDENCTYKLKGLKDKNNEWSTTGHPERIVKIGRKELQLFARIFNGDDEYKSAKISPVHSRNLMEILRTFADQKTYIKNYRQTAFITEMWHEANDQKAGYIRSDIHFPEKAYDMIYSGPHIGLANPVFKSTCAVFSSNSDYDLIDLTKIKDRYFPRCNYSPSKKTEQYINAISETPWGVKYNQTYRFVARKMLNLTQERTLMGAIISFNLAHTNGLIGITFKNEYTLVLHAGCCVSLPYDFYIKIIGKSNLYPVSIENFPVLDDKMQAKDICIRSLLLNCLTSSHADLWRRLYNQDISATSWSKTDKRLDSEKFTALMPEWNRTTPLRTDYERRQALVELDVLVAMALGMTLDQLKTIYRIQFPVLSKYEADTWYDRNGRIVFSAKNMGELTYKRPEWEQIKDAKSGVFTRTIIDDTMPGGPVERTIEYVAPFDRCNREQDYETAWVFFEKKYKEE